MTSTSRTKVAPAGRAVLLSAAVAACAITFAGGAYADAGASSLLTDHQANHQANPQVAMHGDPGAAAPYWREQQQDSDCGEMAVADVVGQITGNEPTEQQIDDTAGNTPSVKHSGSIYRPSQDTSNRDLPVLLAHYGIQASDVDTNVGAVERDLDQGDKVIVGVNDQILWNESGDRTEEDHFVVVTGIDTDAGVVHVNDSGRRAGRDEQVSMATFKQAWDTSDDMAIVTS
ncbi:C39 family peptidase [Mycobacterium sp.]|uniref:C39 family peptidase n=1 Tax=Mycobacterium sp. TaxID=1785 RepID=UPI003C7470B2